MSKSTPLNQLPNQEPKTPVPVYNPEIVDDDVAGVLDQINNDGGQQQTSQQMYQQQFDLYQPPNFPQQLQYQDQRTQIKSWTDILTWNTNTKIAISVIIVFVAVSLLPIESFVFKYVAIDKIPHSTIAVKAVMAGIVVFCLTSFVL